MSLLRLIFRQGHLLPHAARVANLYCPPLYRWPPDASTQDATGDAAMPWVLPQALSAGRDVIVGEIEYFMSVFHLANRPRSNEPMACSRGASSAATGRRMPPDPVISGRTAHAFRLPTSTPTSGWWRPCARSPKAWVSASRRRTSPE